MEILPPQAVMPHDDSLRRVALMDYCLHIAGMLFSMGLLSIVAVIVNYIKRDDARGTVWESHMNWQIRTFWWTLLWAGLAMIPTVLSFGLVPVVAIPAIWYLYRMIKGLVRLNARQPMPA